MTDSVEPAAMYRSGGSFKRRPHRVSHLKSGADFRKFNFQIDGFIAYAENDDGLIRRPKHMALAVHAFGNDGRLSAIEIIQRIVGDDCFTFQFFTKPISFEF